RPRSLPDLLQPGRAARDRQRGALGRARAGAAAGVRQRAAAREVSGRRFIHEGYEGTRRIRSGIGDRMAETELKVGDMAPDFTLHTDTGATLRLADLRGRRVVLYFYPEDDTTGCTTQACALRDAYPAITEQNAVVLGISP